MASKAARLREAYTKMKLFHPTKRRVEGQMRSVYTLRCAKRGDESEAFVVNSPSGEYSPEVVIKHFEAKGWKVDRLTGRAISPEAQRQEEVIRAATAERNERMAKAEEPRPMTYEEAKRVREAIREVYLEDCYAGAESDASVAEQLGMPVGYVREVRGTEFGSGENEAARQFMPQIEPIEKGIGECKEMVDKAMSLLAEVDSRVIQLNASMRDLQKQASSIQKSLR